MSEHSPRKSNRRTWGVALLVVAVAALGSRAVLAQSGALLAWFSVNGGGGVSSNGSVILKGTIGQAGAGVSSNGTHSLASGFMAGLAPSVPVGIGQLSPQSGSVAANVQTSFVLTWTHPILRWRDLNELELRFRDSNGVVLWARFTESRDAQDQDNSFFSLLDVNGAVIGTGEPLSDTLLETNLGALHLAQSQFAAAGPDAPSVTVTFTISFKGPAADRNYAIELLASDDFGNQQGPEPGGTFEVTLLRLYLPLIQR